MKPVSNAVAYALLIPELQKAGREVGYAIAVHGSMARDLDVVAIPWTEEAVNAERLIMHLLAAVDGRLRDGGRPVGDGKWETVHASTPAQKPHGRRAAVFGCKSSFIHVNVARRQAETVTAAKQYTAEVIIDGSYIADFDGPSVDAALERTASDLVKRVNKIVSRLPEADAKPVNEALALLGV